MGNLVFQATLGGQVNLVGPNTASTYNINVPSVNGNLVTTGDTGTVTNTMLAGSIANAKLTNSSVTLGSTSIALGATSTTLDGVNIGATTAGTGAFTTLSGSTSVTTPIVKSASSLTLQSNGTTTALTIDTSQNVGIGVTSPQGKLQVYASANDNLIVTSHVNAADGPAIKAMDSTATNYKSCEILSAELRLGGQNNILFGTSGTGGSTERMRIDSSGNLLVGTTSAAGSERLNVTGSLSNFLFRVTNSNGSPVGQIIYYSGASPNGTGNEFIVCNDSTTNRFTVRSNGGIANYSANNVNLSDRQEKKDFLPAKSYLETICAIPVQTFNYIDQTDELPNLGVVAQDVQAVAPELVSESDWSTEKDGSKMRLSVYQTDLQYALMKSIQELKAINDTQAETINALTARVVALESK